jgi:hypothetical protein
MRNALCQIESADQATQDRRRLPTRLLLIAFATGFMLSSGHGQTAMQTPIPPKPYKITVEAKRLKLPDPFTVTVEAKRLKLPDPFTVTVEARRLKLPEPFTVAIEAKRLKLPDPFTVTVEAKHLKLPEPFTVTVEAKRLKLPEPFTVTIEAKRLKLPDPFTVTIEAKREACGAGAEQQLAAATALIGRNALGAAENTLNGIDRKLCPRLVPRIEAEKARITQFVNTLIAEADAAGRACNIHALGAIASKLQATEHPSLAAPRSRVVQLRTTIAGAEEAYLKAIEQYRTGDFTAAIESYGRARASLDGTGGACPQLGQRIASGLDKARRTRDAIDRIDTALRSCDGRGLVALLKDVKTIPEPHQLLAEKIAQLEKVAPLLSRFDTAFERARQLYEKGDLAPAKSELRRLDAELEALGGTPDCPDLRNKVKDLIERIAILERDLGDADDAIRRCDPNPIDLLATQFRRDPYHRLIRAKIPELERAKNRCIVSQTEADAKACNTGALEIWADTVLTEDATTLKRVREIASKALLQCRRDQDNASCRAQYGELAVAVPPTPGLIDKCMCKPGYDFNPAKTRCVTPAEIMEEGHDKCRGKYGENAIAIGHMGEGKFQCNCKPGTNWNNDQTACTGAPADGNAICANEFGPGARALRRLSDGRWDCTCAANLKWNEGRKRCIPLTGADGNAACRRQFGPASYATRYAGNGVWDCYTPQPVPQIVIPQIPVPNVGAPAPQQRCHARRDGRPGLHCE